MVKLLVLAILLASSPANGLIETLFRAENNCYSGCQSNYATNEAYLDACKKGCDFRLHNEDCATQCIAYTTDPQTQSSCQVGCTLSQPIGNTVQGQKPNILIDPIPNVKAPEWIEPVNPEPERPRSIILIRLRQRPSVDMPAIPNIFNSDASQFFNNIIRQFQDKANEFEQSVRQSFEQKVKGLPQSPSEFGPAAKFIQSIPIIRLRTNMHPDSSSESSEQIDDKRPLLDNFKHMLHHPRERLEPANNRVHQFFTDVRSEWNDLVRKQPKIPVWIFLAILLSSSAILWYMVMSLCRRAPSRDLSIRAQELIFHPYEYDVYEKEKIQPDDHPYEVTESLPIKVKLTNI